MAAVPRGTLVIRALREDRLECWVCSPALHSCSRSRTSTLGELLLRCLVPHRIAPGEFLSGSLDVQAPVQFHPSSPSSSAPEGPIVARLRSLGEKLTCGSSCDCSSPGLQVGWLGRKCLLSVCPGTPLPLLGNLRLGFPSLDRSEPLPRQFCGRAQGSSFFPCLLCRWALRGELLPLVVLPQLETVTTAMASTNCVVLSWHHQGRVECLFLELSASHNIHFLRVTRGGRVAWGSVGTWQASSTPNDPRLCLHSFSCCLEVASCITKAS